jgi:hypothetical protein
MKFHSIFKIIKKIKTIFSVYEKNVVFRPYYRVIEIAQTEHDVFIVTVQIINRSIIFTIEPEEILANDKMVNQFSPHDIRTLTYLGYLSIHNPKYKILAQRISQEKDHLMFALKKKGYRKLVIKTANEIMKDDEILDNLSAKDAHIVGYTLGSESILNEKNIKYQICKDHIINSNEKTHCINTS